MLKKLIKYDLISMLKFISIFYILGIIFAVLTRIFFSIENSFIINILGQITTGATISMLVSILINNLMRFWVRFKNTLYDDESYLTHTLPVSKSTLYLSKFITSFTVMVISIIVATIILFIAYYSKDNIELLKTLIMPVTNILNTSMIKLIIIFGFISYIVTQLLVLVTLFIVGLFNKDILNLFTTNIIMNTNVIKTLSYISIIIYSVLIILNLFISIKIFKKGVNVD